MQHLHILNAFKRTFLGQAAAIFIFYSRFYNYFKICFQISKYIIEKEARWLFLILIFLIFYERNEILLVLCLIGMMLFGNQITDVWGFANHWLVSNHISCLCLALALVEFIARKGRSAAALLQYWCCSLALKDSYHQRHKHSLVQRKKLFYLP